MMKIMIVFKGVIIEESLADLNVLSHVKIVSTRVEPVTDAHETPWAKQWTLHNVEISGEEALHVAGEISNSLVADHAWYADFKSLELHYIIYRGKVFMVDRTSADQYNEAKQYGLLLGIPAHQVDFHPDVELWERK
ncbi:hypothetical protein [Candidatus Lucifugimonas marina]|uniref:Uncharacterized protein n=2 Tax=Candidatus Lucifugimonas marina TaxID=3038979 RepID=A0AAJ5ZCZ5_9CHLR|nr:hypothetical protein GKO48_04740 [SAR202 cluster bacterium JH1073]